MAEKKVKDYAAEVGLAPLELAKILIAMKVEGVRASVSNLDESVWESVKAEVLEKAAPLKKKAAAKKPAAKKAEKKEEDDGKSGDEQPRMKIVRKKKAEPKAEQEESGAAPKAEEAPAVDVTLPGRAWPFGRKHPISQTIDACCSIFRRMGFIAVSGPELETVWYNFDALNAPANHPSRDPQDTFYLPDGRLLRTQTSPVQIRTMLGSKPP
ncbi:MAG: hypothetical protein J6V65_02985, partial [Fibrobacterales bacterium]|nr:hypothetical protein [Fibrobacterales bacterium]